MALHLGDRQVLIQEVLQPALQKHQTSPTIPMDLELFKCSNKLKVFSWLLLMDRLNTRNLLRRRNFQIENGNYNCVLCRENLEETALHLFFTCPFSRACWEKIGVLWNFNLPFYNIMKDARQNSNNFFMETFIIAAWGIWSKEITLFLK
jgi:hypothetical protein